ncbi:hypothetical protein BpHYR1_032531 [Brachionus plicatilis]|uniref:Uncharacterized protein n=1 Tax=Brachionus plicatilis TaxID=10195 RepID=A0A3M7QZK4_BRAPC|nr:hypothetical protein BpHYR1_032531 [Brachionus plicatilis]
MRLNLLRFNINKFFQIPTQNSLPFDLSIVLNFLASLYKTFLSITGSNRTNSYFSTALSLSINIE